MNEATTLVFRQSPATGTGGSNSDGKWGLILFSVEENKSVPIFLSGRALIQGYLEKSSRKLMVAERLLLSGDYEELGKGWMNPKVRA